MLSVILPMVLGIIIAAALTALCAFAPSWILLWIAFSPAFALLAAKLRSI